MVCNACNVSKRNLSIIEEVNLEGHCFKERRFFDEQNNYD